MASGHVSRAVAGWQDRLLALMAGAEAELNFADEDDVEVGEAVARRLTAGMEGTFGRARRMAGAAGGGGDRRGAVGGDRGTAERRKIDFDQCLGSTRAGDRVADRRNDARRDRNPARARRDRDALFGYGRNPLRRRRCYRGDRDRPGKGCGRGGRHPAVARRRRRTYPNIRVRSSSRRRPIAGAAMRRPKPARRVATSAVSAATGEGMDRLHRTIVAMARTLLPREGEAALRQRQRAALAEASEWLTIEPGSREEGDLILLAERLRTLGDGARPDHGTRRSRGYARRPVRAFLHREMMFHVKHRIGGSAVDLECALR